MTYALRILRQELRNEKNTLHFYEIHIRKAAKQGFRHSRKECDCFQAPRGASELRRGRGDGNVIDTDKDGYMSNYSIEDYAGPRQAANWSDEEVSLRASRYEGTRGRAIEEVELCDVILAGLRAEAVWRGMVRDKFGRWTKPKASAEGASA